MSEMFSVVSFRRIFSPKVVTTRANQVVRFYGQQRWRYYLFARAPQVAKKADKMKEDLLEDRSDESAGGGNNKESVDGGIWNSIKK